MRRRHKHNLSHYRLLTGDMGELIPCGLLEVLPGDTLKHSIRALIRFSPLAAPVMHAVQVRFHCFFVPHRLVWTGWEDFITGGPDGNDASTPPVLGPGTCGSGEPLNYLGLPTGTAYEGINSMPLRGYNLIYNEFYRDQDLVSEAAQELNVLHKVAWEKDGFTGARPWTQKGDDVTLPVGTQAPVIPDASTDMIPTFFDGSGGNSQNLFVQSDTNLQLGQTGIATAGGSAWDNAKLVADLSKATAINVNEFRRMFALQRYAEARARYGSRYTEYLRYLGVRPSDARLQRPEYIGGSKVSMNFSEVMQTAPEGATPARDYGVGDMYGHGVGAVRSRPWRRFFEEHGYVHCLMSVRPRTVYKNHIPRHFMKQTKEEFWQQELMEIGQQEVFLGEVYGDGTTTNTTRRNTWGYDDRYVEYKHQKSQVSADFESTLNYWHLARDLASEPALNQSFIECDPSKRIFNEQTQDSMWCMISHNIGARRLVKRSGHSRIL